MYAAQEMFKTANKVTRPEKALILGFMAGSRGTWGPRVTQQCRNTTYVVSMRSLVSEAGSENLNYDYRTHKDKK